MKPYSPGIHKSKKKNKQRWVSQKNVDVNN